MQLFLDFDSAQDKVCRARLSYAFKVFCAIYGHAPVSAGEGNSADVRISYSDGPGSLAKVLQLPKLYAPRSPLLPAPAPTPFEAFGEPTVLFYAPTSGARSDWLGEIFEWLSCADEYSCTARDAVARVPFLQSYVGRHGLSPVKPYAAIAMRGLQSELQRLMPAAGLQPQTPAALSPNHFIVNTHDVDYMRLRRAGSVRRLLKNAAISLVGRRCAKSASAQVVHAVRVAGGGPDPLDQLSDLADGEARRGVGASYFFIAGHNHRRDANYFVQDPKVVHTMRSLERRGMEVGVHGSYASFEQPHRLREEFQTLRSLGFNPQGHRAHWLRFTMNQLVDNMEATGALYDSSLGWSDTIGFRAGACFAFPLYNFPQERPAKFLELPLVGMDQCMCDASGRERLVDALQVSRKYGWGGISVLWHPSAFGGGQFHKDVGELFWQLVESNAHGDSWVSGLEFAKRFQRRYEEVGLLGD